MNNLQKQLTARIAMKFDNDVVDGLQPTNVMTE